MMITLIDDFWDVFTGTLWDVAPIAFILVFFQAVILRKPVPHLPKVLLGWAYVLVGLSLFLMGLKKALFPLGEIMAAQLSDPYFIGDASGAAPAWWAYYWVYLFAALIGFATTVAEPSLIAVALKVEQVSATTISPWGLRVTVALGVAVGLTLGVFRIVTGTPLYLYILGGYVVVIIQTIFAPKHLIPLAYDSGGVTTSTVTVPLVTALGLGLSYAVPGSNPAVDGFGLIAFASLFPIIAVLGYAQIMEFKAKALKPKTDKYHGI